MSIVNAVIMGCKGTNVPRIYIQDNNFTIHFCKLNVGDTLQLFLILGAKLVLMASQQYLIINKLMKTVNEEVISAAFFNQLPTRYGMQKQIHF